MQNNNKINITSQAAFDAQFNKAIKAGVEKGEFTQPKGMYLFLFSLYLPRDVSGVSVSSRLCSSLRDHASPLRFASFIPIHEADATSRRSFWPREAGQEGARQACCEAGC